MRRYKVIAQKKVEQKDRSKILKVVHAGYFNRKTHMEILADVHNFLGDKTYDVIDIRKKISLIEHTSVRFDKKDKKRKKQSSDKETRKKLLNKLDDIFSNDGDDIKISFIGIALLDLSRCGRVDQEILSYIFG